MAGEQLTVDVTHIDHADVLAVRGEIDMASAPVLRSVIERCHASGTSVLLDFAEVTFMDSSGLGVLIGASTKCAESPSLCVRNASERVRRIFELTGTEYLMCRESQ